MQTKKNILLLCASFFLPCLIVVAALAALRVTPFGDNMLLFGDSYYYFAPGISYFTTVLKGEHSMFYSFSDGIGSNIMLSACAELFHPEVLFFLIGGWDFIPQAFTAAVVFNTSLCGLTMYLCLSGIFGKKLSNLIFSTSYALMGFMVINNYNTPFHMGVAMLPLMVLGLYKLIKEKKILLYIISLAYTLISGFQMGYILCMASFIMFVAYMIVCNSELTGNRKNIIVRYSIASLLGGFLGSAIWIPAFLASSGRASLTDLTDFEFTDNGPILQMAANLFSGAASTSEIINGYPVIFCGTLTVVLVILYFINKDIQLKEKIGIATILGIYGISFYIKTFQTVFQGFTKNVWFNHRQAFVFVFILILIAAREFQYIDKIEIKDIKKAFIILVLSSLVIFSVNYEFISGSNVVVDIAIVALIGAAYVFYKKYPDRADKKTFILFTLVCVSLQLYINYFTCDYKILKEWGKSSAEFYGDIFVRQPLVDGIQKSDDAFYRLECEDQITDYYGQDPYLFHYNGVGHSTYSPDFVIKNLHKLGINWYGEKSNSYDAGITAAMDSLLGIKYIITERDLSKEKNYEERMELWGNKIYQNPYVLDVLILSNEEIKNVSLESKKDIFELQNEIWKAMTGGIDDIFIKEEHFEASIHNTTDGISMNLEEAGNYLDEVNGADEIDRYGKERSSDDAEADEKNASVQRDENGNDIINNASYIEVKFPAARDGSVYMYDLAAIDENYGTAEDALKCLGRHKKGDEVTGRIYFQGSINKMALALTVRDLCIYYADDAALEKYSSIINSRESEIEKVSDKRITGKVNAGSGQLLVFTIPYDKGWKLTIDGNRVETEKTSDLFLSAKVSEGKHTFELEYETPGLKMGIIISFASLICLVLFEIKKSKNY